MKILIIFSLLVLGCNQRQVKKAYVRTDFKSDEAWVYYICTQQSSKTQDGLLKDKKDHNVLECKPLMDEVVKDFRLKRSMKIYNDCKDDKKRYKEHSWQNCYDKIIVR